MQAILEDNYNDLHDALRGGCKAHVQYEDETFFITFDGDGFMFESETDIFAPGEGFTYFEDLVRRLNTMGEVLDLWWNL